MKTRVADLAAFGGSPTFAEALHVGAPNLGSREALLGRINDILDRRWFTNNGVYVQDFEKRICDLLGAAHCVATSNGTVALELAVRALGMHGEVIVPSFTFIATAHALAWQQIEPVFCDVEPDTHQIDPREIESLITPRTTGIVGVHTWGNACDVDALAAIAERRGLALLYDAAHAFACSRNGTMIGNFGAAECFSFHATKFCNSFEGGAITTNDGALAEKLRLMRNFGFRGQDNVIHIGTNGKLNEVSAAMGITSLESLQEFIDVNRRNYRHYQAALEGMPGMSLYPLRAQERHNYQYAVALIDADAAGISRDDVLAALQAENVLARRYFYPGCHRMEPYRSSQPDAGARLPNTESVAARVLVLPTGTGIDPRAIDAICGLLRLIVENGAEITRRMRRA